MQNDRENPTDMHDGRKGKHLCTIGLNLTLNLKCSKSLLTTTMAKKIPPPHLTESGDLL